MNNQIVLDAIQELKVRSEHPIKKYNPGSTEHWNQLAFHTSNARYRLLFGGNRSGKSYAAAMEILWDALNKHPYHSPREGEAIPLEIWVISVEYSTLVKGIYYHLRKNIPSWELDKFGPNVPGHDLPSFIRLKNGSEITFKSAKGGASAREKFQAAKVDRIFIDEEVEDASIDELEMRTLDSGGKWVLSATLVESYDWIVKWEELAEQGHPDYLVVRLNTEQNPHLDKKTVQLVKGKLSDEEQEIRFKGKSRRTTGLIYNTFDPDKHVVEPFEIPLEWPRWTTLDPGYRTFGVLWIAVAPSDRAYIYREAYFKNIPLWEIAKEIKTLEGWKLNQELTTVLEHFVWEPLRQDTENIFLRVIDDKRGSKLITGDEGPLDQLASRYGIVCIPADKAVRAGIEDVRHWLEPLSDGIPALQVFEDCTNFLWEIKRYRIREKRDRRDQNETIDEPLKKDDHLMDAIRYLAREQPRYNQAVAPKEQRISEFERIAGKKDKEGYVDEFVGAL